MTEEWLSNVEKALELLQQYDFHSSMGMMVHLALADADGRSVAVEYVDNEMIVIETPVVTNFYLADGGAVCLSGTGAV